MTPRANRDLKWMLLLIIVLLVEIVLPIVHAQEPSNIVNYPIQNYLSWSNVGEIPWTIDYTSGYNDKVSLKSGPIECVGASILRMNNMHGPAIIRFKWKKDAGSGIGQLIFRVDENRTFECNSRDWTDFSYPLNADRSHILEWTFRKIKSYPLWSGTGWIDNVNLVQMDSHGNGEYVDLGPGKSLESSDNNASAAASMLANTGFATPDLGQKTLKSVENNGSSIELKPNITVIIKEIRYAPQNPCTMNGKISIEPISPRENEILSNQSKLKFEYMLINSSRPMNCTLIIDNQELAYSRKLKNDRNELMLNKWLSDEGSHEWMVKCCECGSLCNTSKSTYFKIAEKNSTTYVNQSNHNEARFIFPTISQAINKTDNFGRIIIERGVYTERIIINKPLTIIGRNRPLLDPGPISNNANTSVISIYESDTEIRGLTIKNGAYGIFIGGLKNNLTNISIIDNDISQCGEAIRFKKCNNCNISNNSVYNLTRYVTTDRICIDLENCNKFIITLNKLNDELRQPKNSQKINYCIKMCYCDNDTIMRIKQNEFEYATIGIGIKGSKRYNTTELDELKMYHINNNYLFNKVDSETGKAP
jgi:hypothetical protein